MRMPQNEIPARLYAGLYLGTGQQKRFWGWSSRGWAKLRSTAAKLPVQNLAEWLRQAHAQLDDPELAEASEQPPEHAAQQPPNYHTQAAVCLQPAHDRATDSLKKERAFHGRGDPLSTAPILWAASKDYTVCPCVCFFWSGPMIENPEHLENRDTSVSDSPACWPALPPDAWQDTRETLHMWTQIVGKVRLALTPKVNHWWNVALQVSARGLTTSAIPYGERVFEIEFDLLEHQLVIKTCDPATRTIPLGPRSVADFYQELMAALHALNIDVKIWKMPVEVPNPIAFDQDRVHASYDKEQARDFWRALVSIDDVFKVFRSRFVGKSSPVHFFWGSFDLAVTRFSGRLAPPRNDPDPVLRKIMQEAYSHEVISAGWWPGGGDTKDAAFYCYAAPEPQAFSRQQVRPGAAFYNQQLGEFMLLHEQVRTAASPTQVLLDFLQSTYEAGATLGKWDRKALERSLEPAAGAA